MVLGRRRGSDFRFESEALNLLQLAADLLALAHASCSTKRWNEVCSFQTFAFFPTRSDPVAEEIKVQQVPLKQIRPSPFQIRQAFRAEDIRELAKSIKEGGMSQPILLRPVPRGIGPPAYEVISGELRMRAAQFLGWTEVKAIVEEMTDVEAASRGFVENVQRHKLNVIEKARGFKMLSDAPFNMTQAEIAAQVGLNDNSLVSRIMAVLDQPLELQQIMTRGIISEGHCRALSKINDLKLRISIASQADAEEWSIRETEQRVEKLLAGWGQPEKPSPARGEQFSSNGFSARWRKNGVAIRCRLFKPQVETVDQYLSQLRPILERARQATPSEPPPETPGPSSNLGPGPGGAGASDPASG
jgi:ParB family chromosome partitioning protein